MKSLLSEFNYFDMPVDVLWMDIDYTKAKDYFVMDQLRFEDIDSFSKDIQE